jgi:hypothetical protein
MDKNQLIDDIISLIDNIKVQSKMISENEIMALAEAETLLRNCGQLYEKAVIFNYLNSNRGETETKEFDEMPETVKSVQEETIIEQAREAIEEQKEPSEVSVKTDEPKSVELTPEVLYLFGNEIPASEKTNSDKKEEIKEESKPKEKTAQPPISDIKAAIGINDKFQFANELFQENMGEYTTAINQFNSSENLESALIYFDSLQKLYGWDIENETVKRLLDIVHRRFN